MLDNIIFFIAILDVGGGLKLHGYVTITNSSPGVKTVQV